LDGIKAAEKDPFYTVQESMNHFEELLIKRDRSKNIRAVS